MSTMIAKRAALHFCTDLLMLIGSRKIREVAAKNRAEQNPAVCHTHDFADANVLMRAAIERVGGSHQEQSLWAEAWSEARAMIDRRF